MPVLEQALSILACPICHTPFSPPNNGLLSCPNRHSYNLSRKGYCNVLTHPVKNEYGKEMLLARRRILEAGFFDPLLDRIRTCLPFSTSTILDAGCGEGFFLSALTAKQKIFGIGIDLSRDGIQLAAKKDKSNFWVVADLAHLPIANHSIQTILNILSPANYQEFQRILLPKGQILKIIPGTSYLQELRNALFPGTSQREYSNQPVADLFAKEFPQATQQTIFYQFPLPQHLITDILTMTPLAWNATAAQKAHFYAAPPKHVTAEFIILQTRNF